MPLPVYSKEFMKELIEIKPIEIRDAELLMSISIETFHVAYAAYNTSEDIAAFVAINFNEEQLAKELNEESNRFFFVHVNGVVAGYCKLRRSTPPEVLGSTNVIELERLYVLQAYQKNKLGGALMQHCIEHAITNGIEVLWLGVWEHNHNAMRFYKKWGFTSFGDHIFMLGSDKQTDLLMKKILL